MSKNERKTALTIKQTKVLELLLVKPSIKEVAEAGSVGESTVRRWLSEPEFSSVYRDARGRLLENTLTRLLQIGSTAVETLEEVMQGTEVNPSARVSAAKAAIEMSLRARDLLDTDARLKAIEEKLKAVEEAKL